MRDQFTRDGVLRAVPQLTDAGIAVYFNADLVDAAGVNLAQLASMRWSPGDVDTLRPLLARLTVDTNGRRADEPGFDARRVRQWGYNAANDLQGIYRNHIGSAVGMFSDGDRVRVRQSGFRRGVRLPGAADQRRSRRPAGVGHQRQR